MQAGRLSSTTTTKEESNGRVKYLSVLVVDKRDVTVFDSARPLSAF